MKRHAGLDPASSPGHGGRIPSDREGHTFNDVLPRFAGSHDVEIIHARGHYPALPLFLQQLGHLDQLLAQWIKQHWERGEPGLSNAQIRQIARLDRAQVKRFMNELRAEEVVNPPGRGRNAAWSYRDRGGK